MQQTEVCRIPLAIADRHRVAESVIGLAMSRSEGEGLAVRLTNAYSISEAHKNPAYGELLRRSGLNLPDGTPVAWLLRLATREQGVAPEPIRGPFLFKEVLRLGQVAGLRHYLFGTTIETLAALERVVALRYPEAVIVGREAPPFGDITQAQIVEVADAIRDSSAHIVWVALGTPKQDFVADALARKSGKVCVGVGAAFDFVAETVPEAPEFVHNTGLEWIYRLCREPRRLWRRYLFGNGHFLALAVSDLLSRRAAKGSASTKTANQLEGS